MVGENIEQLDFHARERHFRPSLSSRRRAFQERAGSDRRNTLADCDTERRRGDGNARRRMTLFSRVSSSRGSIRLGDVVVGADLEADDVIVTSRPHVTCRCLRHSVSRSSAQA